MKYVLWITGVAVVLVAGFFAFNQYIYDEKQGDPTAEEYITASHSTAGLSFEYRAHPEGYVLLEPPVVSDEKELIKVYTLMRKVDHEQLQNLEGTEGPPAIQILVYKNTAQQDPRAWASTHEPYSALQLAYSAIEDFVLNGVPAIRYEVDGLYRSDYVVAANDAFVYLFAVGYMEPTAPLRADFEALLRSINFSVVNDTRRVR